MFDAPLGDVLRRLPVEALVVALTVGAVLLLPRRMTRARLGGIPSRWLLPAASLAGAASAALVALVLGPPRPVFADEWSQLLVADTFARGRLTNPPLPLPRHFEAYNNLLWPSYQSKYQPGHGAFLAVGARLGSPAIGLWLEAGLLGAAMAWMLKGWLPRRWVVLGTVLSAAAVATSYFTQSFWGGAVAAAGGALVLGATPRLARRPSAPPALAFAAGLLLLATSRPYEGFLFAAPLGAAVLWRLARAARPASALRRAGIPLVLGGAGTLAVLGVYNGAVTGSPFVLPQVLYDRTFDRTSPFLVVDAPPQDHGSPEMREYRRQGLLRRARELGDARTFARTVRSKAVRAWAFFLGVPLSLGFLLAPRALTRPRAWLPLAAAATTGLGLLAVASYHAHYAAPAAAAVLLLGVSGLREAAVGLGRRRPRLRSLAPGVLAAGLAVSAFRLHELAPSGRHPFTLSRDEVVATLERTPGPDLVLVRYGPEHPIYLEWIYNSAELDGQTIVWARDLGDEPDGNRELLARFPGRRVWSLLVGRLESPPRLVPSPAASQRPPA